MKRLLLSVAALASLTLTRAADLPVKLTQLDDRVRVEVGGQLFTEYIFKGATRPYCYPVNAVDGTSLVRDYPMKNTPGEDTDHKHHRALMFAHSDVNKIDFWNEGTSGTKFPKGDTVHAGFGEVKSGPTGLLRTKNRWVAPDGRLIATDDTTIKFRGTANARMIDYEVTIHALPDTPLVLGDNKDGTMAIRIAQWMNAPRKVKGVEVGTGTIVTANGARNGAAWGTRAPWCDYYATKDGKTYGIAIFDHPSNLRHPTWWMAREYGLYAANPFGQKDFEPAAKHPAGKGDYTIPAGGSLTLRYRFYFHLGDEKAANIAARYTDYAAGK
ncbi:MAG: PmoA family protein [Verrucomicrobia bacterium]|nr:PmoA family protein [Verrucomicrobiota bacterium]